MLQPKYAEHIREFAKTFGYDPETFTATDELHMNGNVVGHWIDRQPGTEKLDIEFVWKMQDMAKDEFHHSRCGYDF